MNIVRIKKDLVKLLNTNGIKEVQVSKQLFDTDLSELGGTVRIATGKSKQIGPNEWVFDGTEYFIRKG